VEWEQGLRWRLALAGIAVLAAFGWAAPATPAGFSEGFPDLRVSMTGPAGPIPKGQAATYTTVVTNGGTAAATDSESILSLSSYRVGGERPVPNPYSSAESTQGTCVDSNFDSKFGTYYGKECSLGEIAPGASVTVTSVVEINESMDHNSFISNSEGGLAEVTTLVDSPPVTSGSNKIKLRGLPDACASEDFKLKAKAKGAKKVKATLRGPLNAEGKPLDGGFSRTRSLAKAKGAKLKASIEVAKLEAAYYEVKLAAKYKSKSKQKSSVLFQACP